MMTLRPILPRRCNGDWSSQGMPMMNPSRYSPAAAMKASTWGPDPSNDKPASPENSAASMISKVVRVASAATSMISLLLVAQRSAVCSAIRAKIGLKPPRAAGVKTGAIILRCSRQSGPSAVNRPSPMAGARAARRKPGFS